MAWHAVLLLLGCAVTRNASQESNVSKHHRWRVSPLRTHQHAQLVSLVLLRKLEHKLQVPGGEGRAGGRPTPIGARQRGLDTVIAGGAGGPTKAVKFIGK